MPPENPTREIFLHLSTWMQLTFYAVSGVAIVIFVWGFWKRLRKYRSGRSENRFDHLGQRLLRAAGTILANTTVRKGEKFGGFAHSLIPWNTGDLEVLSWEEVD